jgi:hypothetical protein
MPRAGAVDSAGRRRFLRLLEDHRPPLGVVRTPGNGDCMLHAIAVQMAGGSLHQLHADELRAAVALHLREHPPDAGTLEVMCTQSRAFNDLDGYLNFVAERGSWFGEHEMGVVERLIGRPIVIANWRDGDAGLLRWYSLARGDAATGAHLDAARPVFLAYNGSHFSAILPAASPERRVARRGALLPELVAQVDNPPQPVWYQEADFPAAPVRTTRASAVHHGDEGQPPPPPFHTTRLRRTGHDGRPVNGNDGRAARGNPWILRVNRDFVGRFLRMEGYCETLCPSLP